MSADQPWGFEQVTPLKKGGGTVSGSDTFQAGPDGNSFLYTADLPFADVPAESVPKYTRYIGRRGSEAWANRALDPPYGPHPVQTYSQAVAGTSSDLSHALVASTQALTAGATQGGGNLYMRDTRTGGLTLVATSDDPQLAQSFIGLQGFLNVKFVDPDGKSALFQSAVPLVPGVPAGGFVLYSWTVEGGVQAESVLPDADGGGIVAASGAGNIAESGVRDSVPHTGGLKHVYFTSYPAPAFLTGPAFVRTSGETRAVSVSRIPGAPSAPVAAQVDAVGKDGRYLLFHTVGAGTPPLTEDTPETPGASYLYRYDADDDSLTYVGTIGVDYSGTSSAVMQMTQDGQTVAFQSPYALAGAGTEGQQNMYVWRGGAPRFVESVDPFADSPGSPPAFLRLLSPNGRYLSFTDNSPATAARFGYDNVSSRCPDIWTGGPGPCSQVYRFDADQNKLECVSCRPDGAKPKGNAGDPASPYPGFIRLNSHQAQTVTDDGTVFFTTPDDLVSADGNGTTDVYASRGGKLELVSRAKQGFSARFLDASPDGKSVFFATDDPIAPTDSDRAVDVYVTREGAGFPYTAPDVPPACSGGDCRDPLTASLLAPRGPGTDQPGLPDDNPPSPAAPRATVKVVRGVLKGSRLRLTITTSDRGRVRVSGASIKATTRVVGKAGTYTVSTALSKSSRKALSKKGRVGARARVSFTPPFGRAAVKTYRRTLRK